MDQQCVKFRTPGCHGFAVQFSPFRPQFVCATSNNFGIKGKGSLFVIDIMDEYADPSSSMQVLPSESPLFDATWTEANPWVVFTASSDGVVKIFNIQDGSCRDLICGTNKDMSSVDCLDSLVCATSWDGSIVVLDLSTDGLISAFLAYPELAYEARWSPFSHDVCLASGGDGTLRVLDIRTGITPGDLVIHAHSIDALSCDWSKYDDCLVASAGADATVKGWDLRRPNMPLFELVGHKYGIKRLRFSYHHPTLMATASYDFTTRLWDYRVSANELELLHRHSEFVHGLDFSRQDMGTLIDCAWDETVCLYRPTTLQPNIIMH